MPFYAVESNPMGSWTSIFNNWKQCEAQVKRGAQFKKFKTRREAICFINAKKEENKICNHLTTSMKEDDGCLATEQQLAQKYGVALKKSYNDTKKSRITSSITQPNISGDVIDLSFDNDEDDQELFLALSAMEYLENDDQNLMGKKRCQRKKVGCPIRTTTNFLQNTLYNFEVDEDGYVNVYIAGNCKNVGSWNGIAGFGVFFGHQNPLNVAEAANGRITRNVGDIEAAIKALNNAKTSGIQKICLNTTSDFLINVLSSWLYYWRSQGWRTKSGCVVQNRKALENLDSLLRDATLDVKWKKFQDCPRVPTNMTEACKLARIGNNEYLRLHPSKDSDRSFDFDFDYDFF